MLLAANAFPCDDLQLIDREGHHVEFACFNISLRTEVSIRSYINKKAVLPQGNRAMPQVFFSVEVRQQHSLQV